MSLTRVNGQWYACTRHFAAISHDFGDNVQRPAVLLKKPKALERKDLPLKLYAVAAGLWGQLGATIVLTQQLGWDLMEPVTYLLGLKASIFGALFYLRNQKEFIYENLE